VTLVRPSDTLALVNLTDQALRVRAVEAASTYDVEALVQVTQAYMTSGSRKGARTSPKTLAAYSLAVRDFIPWAQNHGVQLLRPGRRDGGRYVAQLQTRPSQGRGKTGTLSVSTVAQRPVPGLTVSRRHGSATP
jgi:integrase/recombinase XerC